MFLIRSAEISDFDAVMRLARILDSYNLPAEKAFVRMLLRDSVDSFKGKPAPAERKRFLFVAEDLDTRQIVGCSLIIARHGTKRLPHIAFRVGFKRKKSRTLHRMLEHQTLKLTVNYSGFTEIGGLVVLPQYRHRRERLAVQLSHARFAYLAWKPAQFRPRVLVEYLPQVNPRSGNQFWRVLGARFTHMSYRKADRLSVRDKEFILSLFPRDKIYCGLLPKSAVQDLGVPGPGAQASLHMLRKIGFRYLNQVDPFDGGPHYSARLRNITVVRRTRFYRCGGKSVFTPEEKKEALVMITKEGKVRAMVSSYAVRGNSIDLSSETAKLLKLNRGDRISVTPVS